MRAVIALALVGLAATAACAADDPESRVHTFAGAQQLDTSGLAALPALSPGVLSIYVAPHRPLVTIMGDGKVILGEGYTPDEAARVFWEQIGRMYPAICTPRETATCVVEGRSWPARDGLCSVSDAPP